VVCFIFAKPILNFLTEPLHREMAGKANDHLIYTDLTEVSSPTSRSACWRLLPGFSGDCGANLDLCGARALPPRKARLPALPVGHAGDVHPGRGLRLLFHAAAGG